jgi:hypothetical protein
VADISRPLDPRHRSSHQGKHHRHHQVSARDPKANRDRHTRRHHCEIHPPLPPGSRFVPTVCLPPWVEPRSELQEVGQPDLAACLLY